MASGREHCVVLWLPLGVGWVHGGNHLITTGIIHARGEVTPEYTYDISRAYKHVVCDGVEYKHVHDGKRIGPVHDLEMAAIFEIGRLIHKRRCELLTDLSEGLYKQQRIGREKF